MKHKEEHNQFRKEMALLMKKFNMHTFFSISSGKESTWAVGGSFLSGHDGANIEAQKFLFIKSLEVWAQIISDEDWFELFSKKDEAIDSSFSSLH